MNVMNNVNYLECFSVYSGLLAIAEVAVQSSIESILKFTNSIQF